LIQGKERRKGTGIILDTAAGAGRALDILVTCHNMNVVLYGLLFREGNPAVDMLGYSRSDLSK
jgi:hypothetical protein